MTIAETRIIRTPIIPGVNDTLQDVAAVAEFVRTLPNLLYYELLPFHPLAKSKYASLGLDYRAEGLASPTQEHMDRLAQCARGYGLEVR